MNVGSGFGLLALQAVLGVAYYFAVLVLVRLAGKRLAGQMTTFDLVVLIGLVVVSQQAALLPGAANAAIFVLTVLITHRAITWLCASNRTLRHFIRGRPRPLVHDGRVIEPALRDEGVSLDELMAGLRKLGFESPSEVKLAMLEETGHVSAIAADERPSAAP